MKSKFIKINIFLGKNEQFYVVNMCFQVTF